MAREMTTGSTGGHRRRVLWQILAGAAVLVVAAAVVIGVAVRPHATTDAGAEKAQTSVAQAVASVPASVLDQVGIGTAQVAPSPIDAPALTVDGKPQIAYFGGEFCPYCAAERWPFAVALSRFGTFSGLGQTSSASDDVYPNTPTLSFHGATFSSDVLSLTALEIYDRDHKPLDQPTAAEQKILDTFDAAPYVPADSAGSIPFIDFGGKYLVNGAQYDPKLLAGKTHAQVAAALSDASSPIAQAVDGTANVLTAAICATTDQQPTAVCSASGVRTAAAAMQNAEAQSSASPAPGSDGSSQG